VVAGVTADGLKCRAILEFDIAGSIPSGSTINAVTFEMGVVRQSNRHVPSAYALHRFLKDWNEGVGGLGVNGSPALVGETTWNSQFHGTTPWSAAGGQAGVEFQSSFSAAGPTIDSGTGTYTIGTTATLVSDVQAWADNPATNHGWFFLAAPESDSSTARRFSSSEELDGGLLPRITVQYTLAEIRTIPEPSTLFLSRGALVCCLNFRRRPVPLAV
jgi:hypothetical protein